MPVLSLIISVSAALIIVDVGCYFWLRANEIHRAARSVRLARHLNS